MSLPIAIRAAVLTGLAVLTQCGTVERSLRQASSGHEVDVSADLDKDTADAITDFLAEDANTSASTEPQATTSKVAIPTTTTAPRPSEESTTSSHRITTSAASTARTTTSLRRTTTSAAPASTTSTTSRPPASTTSTTSTTSTALTSTTSHNVSQVLASSKAGSQKAKKAPAMVRSLLATTPEPANNTQVMHSTTTLPEKDIAGLPMADLVDEEATTTTTTSSSQAPAQAALSSTTTVVPSMADAIKGSIPGQKQNSSSTDTDSPNVAAMRAEIKAELEKEYSEKFKAELRAQLVKELSKDQTPVTSTLAITSPSTTRIATTTTTTTQKTISTTTRMSWDELYNWENTHDESASTTSAPKLPKVVEVREARHARRSREHHHALQHHYHRAGLVTKGTLSATVNTEPQEVVEHPSIFQRVLQQISKAEHGVMDFAHLLLAKMGFTRHSSAKTGGGQEVAAMVQTSESTQYHQNPVKTATEAEEQRLDIVSAGDAWASFQEQDGKVEYQANHDPALKNAF